ncbi:hypothetical protein KAU92_04785 [Candidatus Bathyarchaeota archaeon]|nr:hypothetical protein [Candidatus Bathyarchaeota archaeon]
MKTVALARALEYVADNYSEGCKATWIIDFGELDSKRMLLDTIRMLRIENKKI